MGAYIDITYADGYINYNPYIGTKWQNYTDAQKNAWIDYVEDNWIDNIDWIGDLTSDVQANDWPRNGMDDNAQDYLKYNYVDQSIIDRLIDNVDVMFDDLKRAVCETIIALMRTQQFNKLLALQEVHTESFTAGVTFKFREEVGETPLPKLAWRLMYLYARVWWLVDSGGWITRV
jgi:hypothetical protein